MKSPGGRGGMGGRGREAAGGGGRDRGTAGGTGRPGKPARYRGPHGRPGEGSPGPRGRAAEGSQGPRRGSEDRARAAKGQGGNSGDRGFAPQGRSGNAPVHRPGGKSAARFGQAPALKPSKPALGQLLAHYGVRLQPHTLDQLWSYHQLLREHNHDQDLTRLIGFDTIAQRHYADCMILHGLMQGRWPDPLVDVGTGAGFPGLMIKLMSPSTRIVLAEPRPRRVQFLELTIRELGLKGISVFGHKVTSRSLTQPFAGAITRAFETVEKTLPRFGGCLGIGGKAIFMKGPKAAEEVAAFQSDEYKIIRNHAYRIPNTQLDRVLLILERIKIAPARGQAYDESQERDVPPADPDDG